MMQFPDFLGQYRSSTTTEYFDMTAAIFIEKVFHVFEELHMPALVRSDGNTLHVLLDSAFNDLFYRTVMTKMNDLCTLALQNAPHNIDCCIMSIKQRSRCNNSYFI